MRCYYLVVLCLLVTCANTEPDPKKYKPEKDNDTPALTKDERKFLREVEEKFGVKSDVPVEIESAKVGSDNIKKSNVSLTNNSTGSEPKPLLPAVIAIEIFNDTDTKSKGKRTIDANLGYGYRTNNGYKYTYFGKPSHDNGKFMIYPYSQQDIPGRLSVHSSKYSSSPASEFASHATSVEIQPSQAFELVKVKNEQSGYDYQVPSNPLKTQYEDTEFDKPSQTLYTTYNGQEFSGVSGQFPSLMPNYFVDPTQLIKNPQYQDVGLTQDHLHTKNTYINPNQRIVPVLVLRVPSSYLKNPTAELYADLPKNYPLSQHLNNVNLQELVNQYFQKNGYPFAPKITTYQNSALSGVQTEGDHYSNPYASPAYTQADNSGINYSAVKPVMAKYPGYSQQQYVSQPQAVYEQPEHQQYQYQYVNDPQTDAKAYTYYNQPQYIQQANPQANAYQGETVEHQAYPQDAGSAYATSPQDAGSAYATSPQDAGSAYATSPQSDQDTKLISNAYKTYSSPQQTGAQATQYEAHNPVQHDTVHEENQSKEAPSVEYGPSKVPIHSTASQYYASQPAQKESVSVLPSRLIHSENFQVNPSSGAADYSYDTQSRDASHNSPSENYPSKDHTVATVYPYQIERKPTQQSVQSVSYVTPIPSAKYQSQYRVMVPQTVLSNPSQSANSQLHYRQHSQLSQGPASEHSYRGTQGSYSPSSQTHPQTYYTYSKRMVKPNRKPSRKTSRKPAQTKTST